MVLGDIMRVNGTNFIGLGAVGVLFIDYHSMVGGAVFLTLCLR